MKIIETEFDGLFVIEPNVINDERGWFMRAFDSNIFSENIPNFKPNWKQVNHSHNVKRGTFRGLHYQLPPYQETKFIRCISGALIDYALDLRKNSKTFLKVFKIELSQKNRKMVLIPKGFAHGFYTIMDNTDLLYFVDEFYNPQSDCGVHFQDSLIKDPLDIIPIVISTKDNNLKRLINNFNGI